MQNFFPNIRSRIRFTDASKFIWSKFHTKESQMLGTPSKALRYHGKLGHVICATLTQLLRHFNVFHEFSSDIHVKCNWVDTRWQQYSTHLHTNNTQNNTIDTNSTQNNTIDTNSTQNNTIDTNSTQNNTIDTNSTQNNTVN